MDTIAHLTVLTVVECCSCHVTFGIPENWVADLQQSHAAFYCPAGHAQSYTAKSEADKLRDRVARERQWLNESDARLTATRDQLKATQRSLAGHKAAKTRIKNRIAAGVCPCCNRSFQNVARHMTGQHPAFNTTEEKS